MAVRRVGVLTNGGDCPGLNAAIRSIVKTATGELGIDVLGIRDGYAGLLHPIQTVPLDAATVQGLLPRGGTLLGTSRVDPFHCPETDGIRDRSQELAGSLERLELDALVT